MWKNQVFQSFLPFPSIKKTLLWRSVKDYSDLSNRLLFKMQFKITRPDGVDIDDGASIWLINYPRATILSQFNVSLGDTLISQSSNTCPYQSIVVSN